MINGNKINTTSTYTKNQIQGNILFNSKSYLASDIFNALFEQGIPINQIGSNIKIGHKVITPDNNPQTSEFLEGQNIELFRGLTGQIQRIFSELSKLKQHLGLNYELIEDFSFQPVNKTVTADKTLFESKWGAIDSPKLDNSSNCTSKRRNLIFDDKNDVPIIALGMKKKNPPNNTDQQSIIDEFKDLASKGINEDDVLDNLSNKLFNKANKFGKDSKKKVLDSLQLGFQPQAELTVDHSSSTRCEKCNMRIQKQAKFCSKCGNKS